MSTSSLDALSPLDGRYAGKLAAVRQVFSEAGLMRERVRVECAWFLALAAVPPHAALADLPARRATRSPRGQGPGDMPMWRPSSKSSAHQSRREGG
jgi:hypothetical protein